jgi:hypothetical protein
MHSVDATTEAMIRSVLAYAENRLRLDPVPLDKGSRDPAELDAALRGLPGAGPHTPDQVLGVWASVMAPAVISADSPRFLGFIPAAPTKASLLFDMLISCASIQGISWLEAAGAIHAENLALRLIADRAGMPETAGGCFVSGGSAGNLSALVVAREVAKRKAGPAAVSGSGRRWRVAVSQDAHTSECTISGSISRIRSVLVTEEWASSLTATRQRRPDPETAVFGFGPALRLATSRATTRADRFPAEPPETKHPPAVSGRPARSAMSRSTRFSAWIAPAASSHEMPWIDAHEMSMSNSSEALVGAAGMNPRKRGLSAEMTAGAMTDAHVPST